MRFYNFVVKCRTCKSNNLHLVYLGESIFRLHCNDCGAEETTAQ